MPYTLPMHPRRVGVLTPLRRIFGNGGQEVVSFPRAKYYATMGELAEDYGGTSNVIFHRSNTIAAYTGNFVEILTFGHLRDYAAIDAEMHADGRLEPGVRFRSMWNELADAWRCLEPEQDPFESFSPLDDESTDEVLEGEGVAIRRFKRGADGKALQIDMLRPDGSIIVSDRRDLDAEGKRGKYSLILCDEYSKPVKEFHSLSELHRFWLDLVIGKRSAVVFSDSFGIAGLTHTYNRRNVLVVQTFHNHHLRHGHSPPSGYTSKNYLPFLKNIDDFDATVYLTERQVQDIDELMGPAPHRWVIPNSRTISTRASADMRQRNSGLMVGRLVAGKQTTHAVHAIAQANGRLVDPVSLDIYGEGSDRGKIEAVIAEKGASTVRLLGHDPAAPERFADASFSLLTSRSEAMSLVLVESMARGCIPIAYDVRYGPQEIITHGVDGLLIRPNDIDGMSRAIESLQTMSEDRIAIMREMACKRANDFSDVAILKRWAHLLESTMRQKHEPKPLDLDHRSTHLTSDHSTLQIDIEFSAKRPLQQPRAHLVLSGRTDFAITRTECKLDAVGTDRYRARVRLQASEIDWFQEGILDAAFDMSDQSGRHTFRLPFEGEKTTLGPFSVYPTAYGNLSFKRMP